MRKYNRRILTALVVAYKRGVINRKPLNRWLNKDLIFFSAGKYVAYLILFSILFVILDKGLFPYFDLNKNIIIYGYFIQKSRLISGIVIGILAYNLYQLIKYIIQVVTVQYVMKHYKKGDGDIEKINNVTFKIHV